MKNKYQDLRDIILQSNDELCPGCLCEPGDNTTDWCYHPQGCGYTKLHFPVEEGMKKIYWIEYGLEDLFPDVVSEVFDLKLATPEERVQYTNGQIVGVVLEQQMPQVIEIVAYIRHYFPESWRQGLPVPRDVLMIQLEQSPQDEIYRICTKLGIADALELFGLIFKEKGVGVTYTPTLKGGSLHVRQ